MKYSDMLHPVSSAFCFLSVLTVTMFVQNPLFRIPALLGGIAFYLCLDGKNGLRRNVAGDLILFFLVAVTNPLFVHNGVTPLFFLNGNAVTLEAVLCGADISVMLLSAVFWFRCVNIVMTSDKLLYLFGKLSPRVSVLLSSALRFVPLFKEQANKIRTAQKALGLYASDGIIDRIRASCRTYSALISWALENSVDTGASMKGRGYELRERTLYSSYKIKTTDAAVISVTAVSDVITAAAALRGSLGFSFYPRITELQTDTTVIAAATAFCVIAFLPFILEAKEAVLWRYYRSKI